VPKKLRQGVLRLALRLTPKRLAPRQHERIRRALDPTWYRHAVGGMWNGIGRLQFDFMVGQGLQPYHSFLDVGCGSLRGGLYFIRYLDQDRYCGMDLRAPLLKGGQAEIRRAGLQDKGAVLLQDGTFRFSRFERRFDLAIAQSLFTHLPFNAIMRCLTEMEGALAPGGRFYATFFANNGPRLRIDEIRLMRGGKELWPGWVRCDSDPYYYDPDIFRWAVDGSTLDCTLFGDWGHPADQQMLLFTKKDAATAR
jgi:SAM-dependent methyltransferase